MSIVDGSKPSVSGRPNPTVRLGRVSPGRWFSKDLQPVKGVQAEIRLPAGDQPCSRFGRSGHQCCRCKVDAQSSGQSVGGTGKKPGIGGRASVVQTPGAQEQCGLHILYNAAHGEPSLRNHSLACTHLGSVPWI